MLSHTHAHTHAGTRSHTHAHTHTHTTNTHTTTYTRYAEALRFLGRRDQSEASRLHCNRAFFLLKLADGRQGIAEAAESEAAAAIKADPNSYKVKDAQSCGCL